MPRKVLDGVRPFNEFQFKSCFYHQLIAGLGCFGNDGFRLFYSQFLQVSEGFGTKDRMLSAGKEGKLVGYRLRRMTLTGSRLQKEIDYGHPLLVAVDCYDLKHRKDTYLKKHAPHFILLYGYDTDRDIGYIVDHYFENGTDYAPRETSLSELLEINAKYRAGSGRGKTGCMALSPAKPCSEKRCRKIVYGGAERARQSLSALLCNLSRLGELLSAGDPALSENYAAAENFLRAMRTSRLSLAKIDLIRAVPGAEENLKAAVGGYNYFLSLLWKYHASGDAGFLFRHGERIANKLSALADSEKFFAERIEKERTYA